MAETAPVKPLHLTSKQIVFRDAILSGFTPSEAYRKAYDAKGMSKKSISVKAAELLRNKKMTVAIAVAVNGGTPRAVTVLPSPAVRLSMEQRLDELCCAARLDPLDCFDELNHFKSIRDMPEHVRRAIAGFEVDPVSFIIKVKFSDKQSAIMNYSKLVGDIPRETLRPAAPVAQFDPTQLTKEEWEEYKRLRGKGIRRIDEMKVVNP